MFKEFDMFRRITTAISLCVAIGCLLPHVQTPTGAQDTPASSTGGVTGLGVRQQRVERMMEDLERKFKSLQVALGQTEPERAKKLKETLEKAKEMLIQKRMSDITQLLDKSQLETATDGQKAILADIRALLELLLDEKSDKDKAREEFERLSEWKKQIEKIITQERGEKRESDRLSDKDKTLADMQARIKALEAVIKSQKEVIAATEAARSEGIQGLGKIATEQQSARQKAEAIANQIAKEAGDENGPFEAEEKPAAPSAASPSAASPPAASPPAVGGTPMPGAAPEEGAQPAAPPPPTAPRPSEPGEKPLRQAVENQKSAQERLEQGKGKTAQQDEQTALGNLERALAELKKEQSRIASLPPEAFEKLAGKQDDIANQTAQLEQKMQQAGQPSEGKPGEGQAGAGKPQPGQQKVQQAQKSMQQASGDLRKQDPADASRQQGKSIKELQEALQEIEERLAQLREETQIEKLARLEARFREMLSLQQRLTLQTQLLDRKRAEGDLSRSERNAVRAVGGEEGRLDAIVDPGTKQIVQPMGLAGKAQQALDIIIDDGTSVVFPDVVEQLRDDLTNVGSLLTDHTRTDQYTQTLQKEIETTLEELIEALQQAQQQKEAMGGEGGGGGGMQPLLPNSAELKLLRAAQMRINRRTVALDTARPKQGPLDDVLKGEMQTIATRQAEIGEMTVRILERGQ